MVTESDQLLHANGFAAKLQQSFKKLQQICSNQCKAMLQKKINLFLASEKTICQSLINPSERDHTSNP